MSSIPERDAAQAAPGRAPRLGPRDFGDALLCAGAALALALLLAQRTFYKIDGHLYLAHVLDGERSYPRHFLYLPMVFAARDAGAVFGLTLYESARALSALGLAVWTMLVHLASRTLGLTRGAALAATASAATLPSVVFFATVVEVHGPFLAFAGLAALAAAALAARPGAGRAAVFGAACALAFGAHSTGALLPALFLPLLLLYPHRPLRAGMVPAVVTALVLGAGVLAAPHLAAALGLHVDPAHAAEFATDRAGTNLAGWWRYRATLVQEWLVPMLPLSVLAPLALVRRTLRAQAGWLLVAAAVYLFTAVMVLGGEDERGAYLLPFAWPLALLAVRALPRGAVVVVVFVQLGFAIAAVRRHEDLDRTRGHAEGARALAGGDAIALLVGDELDLQAYLLWLPEAERVPLFELARLPAEAAPAAATRLREHVDDLLRRDRAVLVSDAACARITAFPAVTPCGEALRAALATYDGERSRHPGFAGVRLRPR